MVEPWKRLGCSSQTAIAVLICFGENMYLFPADLLLVIGRLQQPRQQANHQAGMKALPYSRSQSRVKEGSHCHSRQLLPSLHRRSSGSNSSRCPHVHPRSSSSSSAAASLGPTGSDAPPPRRWGSIKDYIAGECPIPGERAGYMPGRVWGERAGQAGF